MSNHVGGEETANREMTWKDLRGNLSLGLHAMAQPLAILRASLCGELAQDMPVDELRELVSNSADQVERVCSLFSLLQEFLIADMDMPQMAPVPLEPLLSQAVDGVIRLFQDGGKGLDASPAGVGMIVLADSARLGQVVSSMLLVACGASRHGESVELVTSHAGEGVLIEIRQSGSETCGLSDEARLFVALSEAKIRGQLGRFSWSMKPFSVQIALHFAPPPQTNRG